MENGIRIYAEGGTWPCLRKMEELKRYLDEGTELFFKIVDDTGESVQKIYGIT